MERRKFIIDCDPGIDDAFAILLALSREDIDVLAITCVGGNTAVDQVCVNVTKILEVCDRTDIPVYKGAGIPLLGKDKNDASHFHGEDGLGDSTDIKEPDMSRCKIEHAVDALTRLAAENTGKITLVALGPLTNVALACRMDPQFSRNLKDAVIMGGNCEAKGNHISVCAEFNFHSDVEAAYVCLNELTCPVTIVTWEVCLRHYFEWLFYDKLVSQGTTKSDFLGKITKSSVAFYRKSKAGFGRNYVSCDFLAMCVAVKPDIISKKELVHATVELSGELTRGQMVVDWRGVLCKNCNVVLVQEVERLAFNDLALTALQ